MVTKGPEYRFYAGTKKLSEQLHQTSLTDALTGVNNRRAFDLRFEAEFARGQRTDPPFTLALIDGDRQS